MPQRNVVLPPGQPVEVAVLDFTDFYLAIVNIGTGRASLSMEGPAVDGLGLPLMPAETAGDLGGAFEFLREQFPRFNGPISVVSAAGTTLLILDQ